MANNELGTDLASLGTDCISRQAAISAFMDALTDVGVLDAEDVNTVIQMLPSAQPEPYKGGTQDEQKG